MEIIAKIFGWLGIGKLSFLEGANKDKWTTYLGLVSAAVLAASDYVVSGGDPTNPMFWVLGVLAIKEAVQGYLTNKK